jgi:hypothetical protein
MRPYGLFTLALLTAAPLAWTFGADPKAPARFTLLVQFENPVPELTLSKIRTELSSVMRHSGINFEVQRFSDITPHQEFQQLAVVRVRGECRMSALPVRRTEGALAFAHTSDGQVLPFMDVLCDRIRGSIRTAMWGEHYRRADEMMGRAMARVIAHELYHIIGNTCSHGHSGITKHALTGEQLIADELEFSPEAIEVISSGGGGGD